MRIQRWALTLAMYEYTIAFRLIKAHANADAMSRLPLSVQPATVPQPSEMILLMEQLDKSPVTTTTVRTWINIDPVLRIMSTSVYTKWMAM